MLLICALLGAALPAWAQEPNPITQWETLINTVRLDKGLAPYAISSLLTASAQRHADDLAAHQLASHTGSDGSSLRQRVSDAGYLAWSREDGELIVGENFWVGVGTPDDAMAFFMADPPHRENILSPIYREMGIGIATDANGQVYYVLDFGARPNVLPIFINDGATNAKDPLVAVRLTNEDAYPDGRGNNYMGRAADIRLSNSPNFEQATWQPWEPLVPWTMPNTPGEHTVYVQYRDAAGRTAGAADSIVLGEGAPIPSPTPLLLTPPAEPTTAPELTPSTTVPPTPTPPEATLLPPFTPTPITHVSPSSPGSNELPTVTPFPTWTPLPTPTVPAPVVTEAEPPLGWLFWLQAIAILLGSYALFRRRGG